MITIKNCIELANLIKDAKFTKVEKGDKLSAIELSMEVDAIKEEYEKLIKKVQDEIKPEGFDEMVAESKDWNKLTNERKLELNTVFAKYEEDLQAELVPFLDREKEVSLIPKTTCLDIIDSNDFTVEQMKIVLKFAKADERDNS
jgi:hypothetical protein